MDGPIIRKARKAAFILAGKDPNLISPENELIRRRFLKDYHDLYEGINLS